MVMGNQPTLITKKERLEKKGNLSGNYRKIPKISPGAYISQSPFISLRGLFLEGLMYGGKFAFQNRLG